MKVLAVLMFVAAALAAPQVIDTDAEFVGSGDTGPGFEDGDRTFVIRGSDLFKDLFRNLFLRFHGAGDTETEGGVVVDSNPEDPRNRGSFLSIIQSLLGQLPSPSEEAVVTFKNSSVEVINIGGVPMLVNRTIVEHTDVNGAVYRRVDQRIVGPYSNSTTTTIPAAEDEANELEFEPSTTHKHSLKKRWLASWLESALKKRQTESGPSHNHLSNEEEEEEEEERASDTINNLVPITNEDDIAVNFLGGPRPHNPDAEVFDADLMRETERRFWERRGSSAVSQPMMSQPLRSQPMMSRPLRSQPMMSQPLRSQPMMSQPLRSQPMMSQPLRSQPMMSQPLRSQPMMSQPLRSQPMMSQPLRSRPMMSQPPKRHTVML